jgi:trehalose utilization protein
MEIRTERRNVINIIENFFKDQSLIETEFNHLNFVKQKSKKLVWLTNEEHDEFMANNFDRVNEIDLLLMPIVILTADRHVEMASMILMELPSTLEWRNKCLKAFSNKSESNNRHESF